MSIDTETGFELDGQGDSSPAMPAVPDLPTEPVVHRRRSPLSRRRMWVVGLVILAAIGFLLYKGVTSAVVFFKTTNQAVAQRASLGDSVFQLEGTVVKGTVQHLQSDVYEFRITSAGVSLLVRNTGDPPQLFRPGLPVVVVGHFVGSSNLFASDQIMVKHSQQYIAAHPGRVKPGNP
ncbi:MAG: cytochrome c maturation protein CcmE [Acidimicrobiales bacterium]